MTGTENEEERQGKVRQRRDAIWFVPKINLNLNMEECQEEEEKDSNNDGGQEEKYKRSGTRTIKRVTTEVIGKGDLPNPKNAEKTDSDSEEEQQGKEQQRGRRTIKRDRTGFRHKRDLVNPRNEEKIDSDNEKEQKKERQRGKKTIKTVRTGSMPHRDLQKPKPKPKGEPSSSGTGGNGGVWCCQVDSCGTDLSNGNEYYKDHKVCYKHAWDFIVWDKGTYQRFCYQCDKFHKIEEFNSGRRRCRKSIGWSEQMQNAQLDRQWRKG